MSLNWEPSEKQQAAIEGMVSNAGFGALAKPGFGKTSTTLAAFTVLQESGNAKALLVVAPLRPVYKVWPAEVALWNDFKHLKVEILHGPKKAEALKRKADIYLINYEGLQWLAEQLKKISVKDWPFDVLALDESTKVKNTNTVRYKTLRSLRGNFGRVWILTGTPAPNGIENLFGQIFMLDGGERLGRYITHFRREFFHEYPQRGGYSLWEPREGAEKEIQERIKDITVTFDAPPKPGLAQNVIKVDLSPASMQVYNDLEDEFFAELEKGAVTAVNAAAKSVKLRQIVGGGVYGDRGAEHIDDAKVDALVDLIEEQSGQPLLVAVGFKHEVDRIRKALGYEVPYLGGGVSVASSNQIVDDWNAGKVPVLLAHPTSVAHGLNLQSGGNAIAWFTLTWNAEEFEQMIARVWRQGQKKDCVVHYLVAEGTIDERVLDKLRDKTRKQESLMSALKRSRN